MKKVFNKPYGWIVWVLMVSFVLIAVNNISWGAPGTWHPDEIAIRVKLALNGEWEFDTVNFDYPSLPKYVMYGTGKLISEFGYEDKTLEGLRFVSVLLGGALVGLTYKLSRRIGGKPLFALLAALFAFTSSELLLNASFAHNDIYLAFFVTLAAFTLIQYSETSERIWLYLSCLVIGLAASSKYNGASLMIVPVFLFFRANFRNLFKEWLRTVETLILSGGFLFVGYAVGTPKAALWFVYYFKRALPAIMKHARYGWQPGAKNGFIIQWQALYSALGIPFFVLVLLAILFLIYKIMTSWRASREGSTRTKQAYQPFGVLLMVLLAYDLPILLSYNVQPRFFTSMIPILAVLTALFTEELYHYFKEHQIVWGNILLAICCVGLLVYGGLRSAGVVLSFTNDQRIPATEFVRELPEDTKIEYTLFAPNVNRKQFSIAHNYPIIFLKFPDQELPTSPFFEYNTGEVGIEDRKPDYLVIDNFTYARFSDAYICQIHEADCEFFEKLLAGEANYELIEVFEYDLPKLVPAVNIAFLNPDIRVYQRISP